MCAMVDRSCRKSGVCFHSSIAAAAGCLAVLLAAVARAGDPPREPHEKKMERLTRQAAELHAAGKYAEALGPAKEMAADARRDGRAHYGLAGLYARLGAKDEALASLERAIKGHNVLPALLAVDEDFEKLRSDARFQSLQADAEAEFTAAQRRAKSNWTVTLPSGCDAWKPAPMIVALHGFGGRGEHMRQMWARVADEFGAVLVTPEGRTPVGPDGRSWGGRGTASAAMLSVSGDTRRRLRIDAAHTLLTGFSQGGAMVYGAALSYPKMFRAIAPIAGPFSWREDPAFKEDRLKGLRVYIAFGGADRAETATGNKVAAALFRKAGCDVELVVYEGVGHALPKNTNAALRDVLRFAWPEIKPRPAKLRR